MESITIKEKVVSHENYGSAGNDLIKVSYDRSDLTINCIF